MGEKKIITIQKLANINKRRVAAIADLIKLRKEDPEATLSVGAVIEILRRIGEGEKE